MRFLNILMVLAAALFFSQASFADISCKECHSDVEKQYLNSVHGRARIKSGLVVAPKCVNCHKIGNLNDHVSKPSKISKTNIPLICGKCHAGILSVFKKSVHGKELLYRKNTDAPSCTDCHGIHTISESWDPKAKIYARNIPKTCATCHAVETLMNKYGIKTGQVSTYRETFHGKANLYGQLKAANCSSCHGIHNIKNMKDPESQVSRRNLPKTCGKCHPGALNNPNFSNVIMHLKPSQKVEPIVFYIQLFYILLIAATIGGMLIYNILDLIKRLKEKRK